MASLLLPVLARAKQKAQGIQCMNNHRQLTLAWLTYALENRDCFLYASPSWPNGDHPRHPNQSALAVLRQMRRKFQMPCRSLDGCSFEWPVRWPPYTQSSQHVYEHLVRWIWGNVEHALSRRIESALAALPAARGPR